MPASGFLAGFGPGFIDATSALQQQQYQQLQMRQVLQQMANAQREQQAMGAFYTGERARLATPFSGFGPSPAPGFAPPTPQTPSPSPDPSAGAGTAPDYSPGAVSSYPLSPPPSLPTMPSYGASPFATAGTGTPQFPGTGGGFGQGMLYRPDGTDFAASPGSGFGTGLTTPASLGGGLLPSPLQDPSLALNLNGGGLAPGFSRDPTTGQLTRNGQPADTTLPGGIPAWRTGQLGPDSDVPATPRAPAYMGAVTMDGGNGSRPLASVVQSGGADALADRLIRQEGGSPRGVVNNPGNIKFAGLPGQSDSGVPAKDGGTYASYATPQAGRAAINSLITNAASGRSSMYGANPTVASFTRTYQGHGPISGVASLAGPARPIAADAVANADPNSVADASGIAGMLQQQMRYEQVSMRNAFDAIDRLDLPNDIKGMALLQMMKFAPTQDRMDFSQMMMMAKFLQGDARTTAGGWQTYVDPTTNKPYFVNPRTTPPTIIDQSGNPYTPGGLSKPGGPGQQPVQPYTGPDQWEGMPKKPPPGIDATAWNFALNYTTTGKPPPIPRGSPEYAKFNAAVPVAEQALGIDPTNQGQVWIDYQGRLARERSIQSAFGGGIQGRQMVSLNTLADHFTMLRDYASALNTGDVVRANQLGNRYSYETGSAAVTDYRVAAKVASDEMAKFLAGVGGGTAEDRRAMESLFSDINSPEQLQGAIDTAINFIAGRYKPLMQQFAGAPGGGLDPTKQQQFKGMMTPEASAVFDRPGFAPAGPTPATPPSGTAPAGGGGEPAPPIVTPQAASPGSSAPAGVPAGSTETDRTYQGKPVWKAPDGSLHVPDGP